MSFSLLKHSSARVLEFDAFRDVLAAYVRWRLGKAGVSLLARSSDREWIARQQQLAEETRRFLVAGGNFEFSGLFDAQTLLAKAKITGAVLEINELRDVILVVDKSAEWREMAAHPPDAVRTEWRLVLGLALRIAGFVPAVRSFANRVRPD